jgi:DNA-binding MarR family transcriptional regulator
MFIIWHVGQCKGYSLTRSHRDSQGSSTPAPDSPGFQDGTAYLLAIAGAAMQRRWVEALARLDVTPTQFKVIMSLDDLGAIGQRELSELIGVDPRNCVPIIDSLVGRKLLSRETDSTDRRRRVLRLTTPGRRLARKLESANSKLEEALRKSLITTEYESLRHTLVRVVQAGGTAGDRRSPSQ